MKEKNYTSEFTNFLNQLKKDKPHLEEQQRKGRALLWDRSPIDLEERRREIESTVKKSPH